MVSAPTLAVIGIALVNFAVWFIAARLRRRMVAGRPVGAYRSGPAGLGPDRHWDQSRAAGASKPFRHSSSTTAGVPRTRKVRPM